MEPSRTRAGLASFALASLLVLGATACGSSGSDTTALSGADSSTTSAMPTTTSDLAATTTLLLPKTTVTSTDVTPPSTTSAGVADIDKQGFQFRPVLAVDGCVDIAEHQTDPGEDVLPEDDLGMDADAICYLVGPAGADGNDIATAEATSDGSEQWLVSVTVAEPSRDRLNAMFNACNAGGPTCPGPTGPGQVAIVVNGTVLSAPSVYAEDLANDSFTITGDFTKTEAEQLAQVLNG